MNILGGSFQDGDNNYMISDALEEYAKASAEAAYEDPGNNVIMGFMTPGGYFNDRHTSHWADQKQPSFTSSIYSDNTNWETAYMCMSLVKEAIRKATGRFNAPLVCWGGTKSPR